MPGAALSLSRWKSWGMDRGILKIPTALFGRYQASTSQRWHFAYVILTHNMRTYMEMYAKHLLARRWSC